MSASPRRRRSGSQRGQSTVEFALIVPLIALVLLVAIQVGLVVLGKFAVTHTAREVARVLAVDPGADPDRIASSLHESTENMTITVRWQPGHSADTQVVVVRVEQRVPSLAGRVTPSLTVSATAVMLGES